MLVPDDPNTDAVANGLLVDTAAPNREGTIGVVVTVPNKPPPVLAAEGTALNAPVVVVNCPNIPDGWVDGTFSLKLFGTVGGVLGADVANRETPVAGKTVVVTESAVGENDVVADVLTEKAEKEFPDLVVTGPNIFLVTLVVGGAKFLPWIPSKGNGDETVVDEPCFTVIPVDDPPSTFVPREEPTLAGTGANSEPVLLDVLTAGMPVETTELFELSNVVTKEVGVG